MNIIRTKDDLFSIPPEKKTKHDNGVPTHKAVYCTIRLYFELLMKHLYPCPLIDTVMNEPSLDEIIDSNDKCNRLDRNDLKKKQGILRTIFKGRPIPDLSLVVKEKWRMVKGGKNFCKVLAVNDGGHRSRTVLEFKLGLFRTSSDTFFTSEKGSAL